MIIKKLPNTFYPVSIHVVIADNWEEVDKKYKVNSPTELCATVLTYEQNKIHIIFIKELFKPKYIPHELVHVISEIYKYIGAKYDVDNDEHYAYLMDWLFEQVEKITSKYI